MGVDLNHLVDLNRGVDSNQSDDLNQWVDLSRPPDLKVGGVDLNHGRFKSTYLGTCPGITLVLRKGKRTATYRGAPLGEIDPSEHYWNVYTEARFQNKTSEFSPLRGLKLEGMQTGRFAGLVQSFWDHFMMHFICTVGRTQVKHGPRNGCGRRGAG